MTKENIPLSEAVYGFGIVLVALVVGFVFISWSFSNTSGWKKLRAVHGVNKADLLQSWSFQSAVFDNGYGIPIIFGSYRNCLNFGYSSDGVYLSGMFPFALFHRPILIPWKDAVVTWTDDYSLYSLSVTTVNITIPKKVYDGLLASQRVENTNSLLAT